MKSMRMGFVAIGLVALIGLGGCPGSISIELPGGDSVNIPLPGASTIVVEVFNDTNYEVDPRIKFDDDSGFFASLAPAETLNTGILAPGELLSLDMDCDKVGLLVSDVARQYWGPQTIGQADSTRTLERDDDYDCGDTVQFHFLGDGDGFGVIVSINGIVVD